MNIEANSKFLAATITVIAEQIADIQIRLSSIEQSLIETNHINNDILNERYELLRELNLNRLMNDIFKNIEQTAYMLPD